MHKPGFSFSLSLLFLFFTIPLVAEPQPAVVSSIKPGDLAEYEQQSRVVKRIIVKCLELTGKNLCYTYGSASPSKGGMDCSGTICYALKSSDVPDVPRTSYTIYHWANNHGNLTRLSHVHSPGHPALRGIKPGDLVFWEGTYAVEGRTPPISHVMLYLGTLKKDGKGVLFGASSGRRFRGKKIHGVSVFDFKVPTATSKARLVAYGPIPGIRNPDQAKVVAGSTSTRPVKPVSEPAESGSETGENRSGKFGERLKQLKEKKPFRKIFSNKE